MKNRKNSQFSVFETAIFEVEVMNIEGIFGGNVTQTRGRSSNGDCGTYCDEYDDCTDTMTIIDCPVVYV